MKAHELTEGRTCALDAAAGVIDVCPGRSCPFWEPGGAVLGPGCALDRLGIVHIPPAIESFRLARRLLDLDAPERDAFSKTRRRG